MNVQSRRSLVTVAALGVLLALYASGVLITLQADPSYRAFTESIVLPLDLMVFMPTAFYFLVIRRHKLTLLFVLPVIYLGFLVVTQIVQPQNAYLVHALGVATLGVDAIVIFREFKRVSGKFKEIRSECSDPKIWFYELMYFLIPHHKVAALGATELMALYYAFFSWRAQPLSMEGTQAFSYHRKSGQGAFVGVLMAVMAIETIVVHLLLMQWSLIAATLLTVASVYLMFWLVGNVRASALRPILVSETSVQINSGLWTSFEVSIANISEIESKDPNLDKKDTCNLGTMGFANCWITLEEAVEIRPLYGKPKQVHAIGLTLDAFADFKQTILAAKEDSA